MKAAVPNYPEIKEILEELYFEGIQKEAIPFAKDETSRKAVEKAKLKIEELIFKLRLEATKQGANNEHS